MRGAKRLEAVVGDPQQYALREEDRKEGRSFVDARMSRERCKTAWTVVG